MARHVTISALGARPPSQPNPPRGQEAVEAMIAFWREQLKPVLCDRPDLIVLPEACDRFGAYTREERPAYYEVRGNQVRDFFAGVARAQGCYIAYSAARKASDGGWMNSTQILDPQGQVVGVYDKNHTTLRETLQSKVRVGTAAPLIRTAFGTIGCVTCFDLNFSMLRRHYEQARPDLLVYCSRYHGGLMQAYWAYACRAHFVGAVAGDECTMISPVGEVIAHSTNYVQHVTSTVNLDCCVCHLDENRPHFQAARERYGRDLALSVPNHLGCALLSSESPERTVDEVVAEFGIKTLDDYFARSLAMHRDPRYRKPEGVE